MTSHTNANNLFTGTRVVRVQERFIKVGVSISDRPDRIAALSPFLRFQGETSCLSVIFNHVPHCCFEGVAIFHRHQHAGLSVIQYLTVWWNVVRDAGQARRHRFQQGIRQTFSPRRQDEAIRPREPFFRSVEARQMDAIPRGAGFRESPGFLQQFAAAHDGQFQVRVGRGETIKGPDQRRNITLGYSSTVVPGRGSL